MACIVSALDTRGSALDMMQPLRRAHFWIWVLLPAVMALVFAAGLAARHDTTPLNPAVRWENFK